MILPQVLYGCSAWYKSRNRHTSGNPHKTKSKMAHILAPLHRRAAQIITGTFRTTAASAAEVEVYLLPIDQLLEKTSLHTTLRILSTPLYDYIDPRQDRNTRNPLGQHIKTLQTHYKI
jgi:hypothetical protein